MAPHSIDWQIGRAPVVAQPQLGHTAHLASIVYNNHHHHRNQTQQQQQQQWQYQDQYHYQQPQHANRGIGGRHSHGIVVGDADDVMSDADTVVQCGEHGCDDFADECGDGATNAPAPETPAAIEATADENAARVRQQFERTFVEHALLRQQLRGASGVAHVNELVAKARAGALSVRSLVYFAIEQGLSLRSDGVAAVCGAMRDEFDARLWHARLDEQSGAVVRIAQQDYNMYRFLSCVEGQTLGSYAQPAANQCLPSIGRPHGVDRRAWLSHYLDARHAVAFPELTQRHEACIIRVVRSARPVLQGAGTGEGSPAPDELTWELEIVNFVLCSARRCLGAARHGCESGRADADLG